MNKEAKITICLLAIIFMGFIIYQIDSQHRALINIIQTHENKMDEVLKSYQNVSTDYDSLLNIVDSLPLGSPLDTLKVSSKYGWRRSPLGLGWQMHSGTDYLAAWHDTVYATGSGIISMSKWNAGYGRCIMIDHAWGYQSAYAHLHRYFVRRGDTVHKGQAIARAGNSGAVTGPHLHYEIRRNGKRANPSLFVLDN
jgi:murein DD-endopeptidase MepM/ murein hydrolase activator NlpD